jgi:hypothetical protein
MAAGCLVFCSAPVHLTFVPIENDNVIGSAFLQQGIATDGNFAHIPFNESCPILSERDRKTAHGVTPYWPGQEAPHQVRPALA